MFSSLHHHHGLFLIHEIPCTSHSISSQSSLLPCSRPGFELFLLFDCILFPLGDNAIVKDVAIRQINRSTSAVLRYAFKLTVSTMRYKRNHNVENHQKTAKNDNETRTMLFLETGFVIFFVIGILKLNVFGAFALAIRINKFLVTQGFVKVVFPLKECSE